MRGTDKISGSLFSYFDIEERIPPRHPLRQVKRIVDDALSSLDAEFGRLYAAEEAGASVTIGYVPNTPISISPILSDSRLSFSPPIWPPAK